MSLRNRILSYLMEWYDIDNQKWINGGEIERLALGVGYKASNASRVCRQLQCDGKLEKRIRNGSVEYRYNPLSLYETNTTKNTQAALI